jgi:hypothetical protein
LKLSTKLSASAPDAVGDVVSVTDQADRAQHAVIRGEPASAVTFQPVTRDPSEAIARTAFPSRALRQRAPGELG